MIYKKVMFCILIAFILLTCNLNPFSDKYFFDVQCEKDYSFLNIDNKNKKYLFDIEIYNFEQKYIKGSYRMKSYINTSGDIKFIYAWACKDTKGNPVESGKYRFKFLIDKTDTLTNKVDTFYCCTDIYLIYSGTTGGIIIRIP
jgi:hypothetical protein